MKTFAATIWILAMGAAACRDDGRSLMEPEASGAESADAEAGANGINLAGDIVGRSTNANDRTRAVVWRRQ
jgi:hypothetical protein